MHFRNLTLLHQLDEEYNTAVNHALSSCVPKDISTFEDDCDTTVDSTIIEGTDDDRDDDNELGYELEEIEDEMMMMLSSGSKKQRIELPNNH